METRQKHLQGVRPAYFTCYNCELDLLKRTEVTEEFYGDQSDYFCNFCGAIVEKNYQPTLPEHCSEPREIDLTEPMVCIVSVVVTEKMIEDNDIPF